MSCKCYVLLTLLGITSAVLVDTSEENCVKFVLDVTRYYQSACIFILHDDSNDMEKLTNLVKLSRVFSKVGSATTTMRFSQLRELESLVEICPVRPTCFVPLNSRVSLDEFMKLATVINAKRSIWIVTSTNHIESYIENYDAKNDKNAVHLISDMDLILVNFSQGIVYEWSTLENRMKLVSLGTWEPRKGLVMNSKDMAYQGRSNLRGRTLLITTVSNEYFIQFDGKRINGFYGDLLMELSRAMNFKVEYILSSSFGSWNVRFGNWYGMRSLIAANVVDTGIGGFTITLERFRDIDFTLPIYIE